MAEYIDRAVALASIRHEDPDLDYAIMRIPAADVRPVVRGKWIVEANRTYYDTRCSACGVKSFVSIEPKDTISFCNYCPNCGAKMEV